MDNNNKQDDLRIHFVMPESKVGFDHSLLVQWSYERLTKDEAMDEAEKRSLEYRKPFIICLCDTKVYAYVQLKDLKKWVS